MTLFAPPPEIIRLTTENPFSDRLYEAMGTSEKRSALCGSRVIVDVNVDEQSRIVALGTRVNACAFGQAAASIMAQDAIGKTVEHVLLMREAMARWIAGEGDRPEWPLIDHLRPERLNTVRKGSVQLAFQALAEAAQKAREAREHA